MYLKIFYMEKSEFTTVILKSKEGYFLTQVGEVENRVICKTIALGANDSPDNWKEITTEEAENLKDNEIKHSSDSL